MKKILLGLAALTIAAVMFSFMQHKRTTTLYFRYDGGDVDFSSLTTPGNWTEVSWPYTSCEGGTIPCVVSVDDLPDYGGEYSPDVIDGVDFAHFLDNMGSTNAPIYVTGDNKEAGKSD